MKAVLDKKKQEFLAGGTSPTPVDVDISKCSSSAEPEYCQLIPCAVGKDSREFRGLPQARGTLYDESEDDESDESDVENSEEHAEDSEDG